ncbi:hypothetical protein [Viridibacillus arvi]|uniref:hypothetical protein n=1 Tax=Viridibacillus arvi TaxID=263475 RepID=UPI0034CD816B
MTGCFEQQSLLFDFEVEQTTILASEETGVNFLDKFNVIDISTEERISQTEADYCKFQEKVFYETRDALKKSLQVLTDVYDKYKNQKSDGDEVNHLSTYSDINVMEKRIRDVYEGFVSRITYYFKKRHKVSLSSGDIHKKYDENSITYSIILDEIFEQLGGLTFKEKAVQEIKVASRETIYKKSNVTIAKNKLSIIDAVWWDTTFDDSKSIGYSDSRVQPMFLALSHFENGSVEMHGQLSSIYRELYRGTRDYDIFSKYEINENKLKSIKMFKNKKVEIVFADNTTAETFKNEYLI